MKDQIMTNDSAVHNFDIGSLMSKPPKHESVSQELAETSILEKAEEKVSGMIGTIEEKSGKLLADMKVGKKTYYALAGAALAVGGAFLLYRFYSGKKNSPFKDFSLGKTIPAGRKAKKGIAKVSAK